jgi:CHAD domain-containing protein
MELELVLHPDDAGKLPHVAMIEAAKAGRIRTKAARMIWHDSPDRDLAAGGLALAEHSGIWQLERLTPGPDDVWHPGTPPLCLAEAYQPSALAHSLPEPLAPVAAFEGKSTNVPLSVADEPVSMVLLRGDLRTVTAEHPVCRLRISGAETSVHAIAVAVAGELRAAVPRASLAAEALATAAGSAAASRRLGAPGLPAGARESPAAAFRHVLGHLTDVILHHAPAAAIGGDDTEPLHQMRVAVRRARSAIAIFRGALACPAFDAVNGSLKTIGSRLAGARDWDVFVTETAPAVAAALPQDTKLAHLIAVAQRRQREAHTVLRGWLTGSGFHVLGIELAWLAASDGWIPTAGTMEPAPPATPLPEFAVAILHRRWRKMLAAGKKIETLDVPALHGLRLRTKRMRYAAEIFVPLFPGRVAHRFLRRLNTLQRLLGNLNDAAAAEQLLREVGSGSGRHVYATGLVLGFAAASAMTLRLRILRAWAKFERQSPFWD